MVAWRQVPRFGVPEVFALVGLLSFLVARFVPVLSVPYVCPMKGIFGIPCATCGMTHAFVALARGDVGHAFAASPFGALLAATLWGYATFDLARAALDLPFPTVDQRAQRAVVAAGVAALLLNWGWLLAHGTST